VILRVLLYFYPETQGFSCPLKVRRIRIGSELVVIPARLTSEPSRKTKWVASFRLKSTWTIYGYHFVPLCKQQLTNDTTVVLCYPLILDSGFPSHCRDQMVQPSCTRGRTSLGTLRIYSIIFEERDNALLSVLLPLLDDR